MWPTTVRSVRPRADIVPHESAGNVAMTVDSSALRQHVYNAKWTSSLCVRLWLACGGGDSGGGTQTHISDIDIFRTDVTQKAKLCICLLSTTRTRIKHACERGVGKYYVYRFICCRYANWTGETRPRAAHAVRSLNLSVFFLCKCFISN